MFCPSCGSKVSDQVKFCPKCGRQLAQPTTGAPSGAEGASTGNAVVPGASGASVLGAGASVAGGATGSGSGAPVTGATANPSSALPDGSPSRRPSKKSLLIALVAAVILLVAAVGGFMWLRTPKPIWSVTEVRQYQNLNLHAVPDWTPVQTITQEHDEQGNVVLEALREPGASSNAIEYESDFDENGACTEQRVYRFDTGARSIESENEGVEAEYDLLGRVTNVRARDGSYESAFSYNLDGSLRVDTTMRDGSTRVIEYDAERFMTRSSYTSESDDIDYEIAVHHEKDSEDRIVKATYTVTDGAGEHTYDSEWTEYEYDGDGNLSTVTVVTGGVPWERWEMEYERIEHPSAYASSAQVQIETAYFRAGDDWFLSRGYIAS